MRGKRYIRWLVAGVGLFLACGTGLLTLRGGGTVQAATEPNKEIVLNIVESDRSALAEGDTLRKKFKFREAIAAYEKLLNTQGLSLSIRAEAEYDIGLSHTWLGEYDAAVTVFNRMLETYKDDPNAIGYAQYCIAWIEVQREKYREAIARLEGALGKGDITDRELAARAQFDIGKIYMSFLHNKQEGIRALQLVVNNYSDTKMYNHPWLEKLKTH
jgi:tetratricopeptide (TPR) repeat protein